MTRSRTRLRSWRKRTVDPSGCRDTKKQIPRFADSARDDNQEKPNQEKWSKLPAHRSVPAGGDGPSTPCFCFFVLSGLCSC
jgi:hypothetical protein